MITGGDLTPQRRAEVVRRYRFSAISHLVFGVAFLGLGVYEYARGRRGWSFDWNIALGPVWLVISWVMWARARKYKCQSASQQVS